MAYSIGKYMIRYYASNVMGEKTEVFYETYHPSSISDLKYFASIRCGFYNLTYTYEKIEEDESK